MKVKPCPKCGGLNLKVFRGFVITKEYMVRPETGRIYSPVLTNSEPYGVDQCYCNACKLWFPLQIAD